MKRDFIDFFVVRNEQAAVHGRLENWGAYLRLAHSAKPAPMWRFTRSNSRMWQPPEPKLAVDTQDGDVIEHIVRVLPTYHREALRWAYVDRCAPAKVTRRLNVSYSTLFQLLCDARELVLHHLHAP